MSNVRDAVRRAMTLPAVGKPCAHHLELPPYDTGNLLRCTMVGEHDIHVATDGDRVVRRWRSSASYGHPATGTL